jgi:prepilin-type N-terminal cleavage/methylation domain-containing protein
MMKNKISKLGFTLIELLAAIIIIVVVIAIAVPLVINMIEIVKREAFRATAYSIADAGRFLVASENESQGYQEFYYLDGKQYNADNWQLDYTGDGPKTGVVVINEKNKVVLAIHNGTYCATKSANTNTVTVTKTTPEDCNAYSIIETCDSWEQIALKYDVNLDKLLAANNETDPNSSTCGKDIKIPVSSNSSSSSFAGGDGGSKIYYKTYYTMGYVFSSSTLPLSYEYKIKLGVLPLNISDIKVTRVTDQNVFESLDDFKRYITKKNMGEVIWQEEVSAPIDISQASVFRDHAARTANMTADDVVVQCDATACYAIVSATVDNLANVNPNTIDGVGQVVYTPIKFTVEFNGEADTCAVLTTTDTTPGTLVGTGTSTDPYLLESVEDLVALSNSVNAGNTYSGKYLSFTNSFDLNNLRSYKDPNTIVFGDINGNGTVEGLLTELSSGAGFVPIGTEINKFSGRILGNANCIFDLFINRPTTAFAGLFGYNNGATIRALSLNNVNITGANYTGGLVGYNLNSTVSSINVTGNVTGQNYSGLVAGASHADLSTAKVTSVIVHGNVNGADYVGGIVGNNSAYGGTNYLNGINQGGHVISSGANVGRLAGANSSSQSTIILSGLSLPTALINDSVNGSEIVGTSTTSINGATINSMNDVLRNINLAEQALDTYIGGDSDGDGYYWDYSDSGVLVQRSTDKFPLTFDLAGAGTAADPYLIYDSNDLRKASLKLGSTFRIMNNIDFTNKRFYMMGSYINRFSGTIDGNEKTLSNINLNIPAASYVGLVGYNTGTISVVKLNNININASNFVGGLTGYNHNGRVIESEVVGNVTGNNYVSLAAGYVFNDYGVPRVTDVIVQGNITGNDYVGGLAGGAYAYSMSTGYISGINKGGNIIATGVNVARTIGASSRGSGSNSNITSSLSMNTVTINGSPIVSTSSTGNHGADFDNLNDLNDINLVETALDTYIGGDNDSNGFYWDYDADGKVVRKKVSEYPLTFSLAGAGTAADPYLIYNYEDLRQAALKLGSVYKLMTDIDLSGKRYYMLGSYMNNFSGTLNGNEKTISNLNLDSPNTSYLGLVGYNKGTVSAIKLNNVDIRGSHYVGALSGYVYNGRVIESEVIGNASGINYVSLGAGYVNNYYGTPRVSSIIVQGNVTGNNYVGGLAGYAYAYALSTGNVSGINKGGSVVATGGTNVGRNFGGVGKGSGSDPIIASSLALDTITVNGATVTSTYPTSNHGADFDNLTDLNDINLSELALDTYIGGDNDGNGYYWDYDASYNLVRRNVSSYPLTFSLVGAGTAADPYLIGNYSDLRQASLKPGSTFKLTADIDMLGQHYYMLGSYLNRFGGKFDGNALTINNLTINSPHASYIGLVGYSNGTITGLNLNNLDLIANNYVGGFAGYVYNSHVVKNTVNGNILGNNYLGLAVGYLNSYYGAPRMQEITVEGNVTGSDYIGGVVGGAYSYSLDNGYLNAINKGGSLVSSGTNIGRIGGSIGRGAGCDPIIVNSSAVTSTTLNGATVVCKVNEVPVACTDPASKNGMDISSSDLSNTVTYTDRGFNFTDEVLDYIWYIDGGTAKFRAGSL